MNIKIKSLAHYPQQLGDGRMVGAAGTSSAEREYDLPSLTAEDKRRVKRGLLLQIVQEEDKQPAKPEQVTKSTTTADDSSKGGIKQ